MGMTLLPDLIAAIIVMGVTEVANRSPRIGALLLTLPIVSILAFIMTWTKHGDIATISSLSQETLVLVPLGLVFFVPLAFASRWGLSFWPAFWIGLAVASAVIAFRFWLGSN